MSDSEESCAGYSTSSDSNVLSSSDGTDISLPDLEVTPPPVVEEEDNQNVQVGGDKRPAADDGWGSLEPRRVRRRADPVAAAPVQQQADDQDAPQQQQQQGIQLQPEWCLCGTCHIWPQNDMNNCCQTHPIWDAKPAAENIRCITSSQDYLDLLKPAPLRIMFRNFSCHHPQRYPDATTLVPNQRWTEDQIDKLLKKQQRLAAYRSMIFWSIPQIRKGQRRPLPSCVYMNIRAAFTPDAMTDEEFADYDHSIYVPELAEAE